MSPEQQVQEDGSVAIVLDVPGGALDADRSGALRALADAHAEIRALRARIAELESERSK
jgi:hypothetical protein